MNIQHLHLHVRDRRASERFYERWLGLGIARRGDRLTFMEDDAGFSLALMDDPAPANLPDWFHFGTRPLYADETLTSFHCTVPDGYAIEIYYERA